MPARRTPSRPRELHVLSHELTLVASLLTVGRSGDFPISISASRRGWTISAGRFVRVTALTVQEAHDRFVRRLQAFAKS